MKCYYTGWITEIGEDLLSNRVSARASMGPKSFLYSNKGERGWKNKQHRKLNEEHHVPAALTVRPERLQIDLKLEFGNALRLQLMLMCKLNKDQQD